tara:strand:+ start:1766 stop:1924 length:159 start_codon:yes stop_codon:yes gene_type:complete
MFPMKEGGKILEMMGKARPKIGMNTFTEKIYEKGSLYYKVIGELEEGRDDNE